MGHIRVDLPNTNNKCVRFGLVNVDTFIIRVGFGLTNVDTIRTLTQHKHDPWRRIANPIINVFNRDNSLLNSLPYIQILNIDVFDPLVVLIFLEN